MAQPKTKIAIVSHSLGLGGAERFSGLLSQMLGELGYEIHNILIEDKIAYDYAGPIYNMGKICENDNAIWRKIRKGILLRRYLKENAIQIVIDNRSRPIFIRELLAKWIYGKRDRIYVVHSFRMRNYFPETAWAARWLYSDARKLVCVSKAIEHEIATRYGLHNAATVYNPVPDITLPTDDSTNIHGDFILFFGRLDDKVKNFGLLLEAFAHSKIGEKGIRLVIMGDGPDKDFIRHATDEYHLGESVILLPFEKNPYAIVKQAKFTVLTSRYEGFPMSIIESLALGIPVVSVDCESGPAEIIQNEYNGLLVPNYNPHALTDAMRRFAEEPDLYHICKSNAAASVAHLSVRNTAAQWQQILEK
jgi:glycosyltransferase involved in cell wall biosynthesis